MAQHIRKTGKGWTADFVINGKRKQLKRNTKKEALIAMELCFKEAELLNRLEVSEKPFTLKEARAQSILRRWAGTAAERTAAMNSQQVVDFFGADTPLELINAQEIERFRTYMLRRGNKPATVNWKVSTISAMFTDAVLYGQMKAAPQLPVRLRMNNTKDRVFSMDEEQAFCEYFRILGHHDYADLLLFLIELGCRFSEAERAITGHVDTVHRTISFLKTKNSRPRTNPVTETLWQVIEPRLTSSWKGHLFPGLNYKAFLFQFNAVKIKLGLATDLELTPHCTRHTCASRMIRYVSLAEVMHWGGWMSLASVQRYLHLNVQSMGNAKRALEHEREKLDRANAHPDPQHQWNEFVRGTREPQRPGREQLGLFHAPSPSEGT